MKAHIFVNNAEGHFFGFKSEHTPQLTFATSLSMSDEYDAHDALEVVFQVCNGADPESDMLWYMHGHRSLSVGDVVQLERNGEGVTTWACASAGWDLLTPAADFPAAGSISTERSDHGLTVEATVQQTRLIHPDWDRTAQFEYLVNDAFFSRDVALKALGIPSDEAPPLYTIPGT